MQTVEKKLEDNMCFVHQVEQLQQDLLVSDEEKSQIVSKLNKAEQHIQVLTATVDTLSAVSNLQTDLRCCAVVGFCTVLL
jgi:hypothetical protein